MFCIVYFLFITPNAADVPDYTAAVCPVIRHKKTWRKPQKKPEEDSEKEPKFRNVSGV